MTSAPKSDKITAALGPAMKLAKSTTFSPEKMLSLAMAALPESLCAPVLSSTVESRRALFEEGGRAFLFVFGSGAEAEIRRFEQQAFALARLQAFVRCLQGKLDSDRCVRSDLLQDGFGARDQISRRDDFVDEADPIGLLRADHFSGQNELQGAAFADQAWQALRSASARNEPECDFRLTKFRGVDRDPDGAGHRRLAAAAERKAVDGRDNRLAEILDQIEDVLPETAGLFGLERRDLRELADVRPRNERFVTRSRQDHATYCSVVPGIFECRSQVLPGWRIQGVEHPGPINRHIGDGVPFLVQDVVECERRSRLLLEW